MLRIVGRRSWWDAERGVEGVGAGAAAAMHHAGREEQARAVREIAAAAKLRRLPLIECDRLARRDERIGQTVIDDQLAAARGERL